MRTFIFGLLALMGVSGICKADVVVSQGAGTGTNDFGSFGILKIFFTTSSSSAGSGGWNLSSINFYSTIDENKGSFTFGLYNSGGAIIGTETNADIIVSGGVSTNSFTSFANTELSAGTAYQLWVTANPGSAESSLFTDGVGSFASAAVPSAWTSLSATGGTASGDFQFSLNGAAVPESGTLLLGGIAAMCGSGGVWWKRRRKNVEAPAKEELPVA